MPFSEILGHAKEIERIKMGLASGMLPHAYLFSGPHGVGKRTIALGFLSSLFCEERKHDFCGVCSHCKLVLGRSHPDLACLKPMEGKKEISIDQVKELIQRLSLRSLYGKKKAALIEEADTLNWPAQNALLKALEEPRGDTLFILLTPTVQALLPTILSRCYLIRFEGLSSQDVERILLQRGFGEDRARLLSRLCLGSVGRAMELDEKGHLEKRAEISSLLVSGRNNAGLVLDWAERACLEGRQLEPILDLLEGCLRDAIVLKHACKEVEIMNPDLSDTLERVAREWSEGEILDLFDQFTRCRSALDHNAQRQLALETSLLRGLF